MAVIKRDHPKYPSANLTKYIRELQTDERGGLVRRTSANKYRFDEPLQHAFAKSFFSLTAAEEPTSEERGKNEELLDLWDVAVRTQLRLASPAELRRAIEAEIAAMDGEDSEIDRDEDS